MPSQVVNGFNVGGVSVQYNYEALADRILKSSIANIYSSSNTYKVDDYVLYAGQLYRCIIEITTPQNFDSFKWEAVSAGSDLKWLKKYYSINDEIKQALLNCFAHCAWTDEHGQDYYDALETALYRTADLDYITVVFDQGSAVIYDTDDLETLRQYLTVTATYEDLSTREITGYTLSGALTVGTSTITVSYGGKTATFDVVVSLGLDSICFGTKTYRDIFITDNLVSWFGSFENAFNPQNDYTYKDTDRSSGYRWSPTAGVEHPAISTSECNSPTHSIDASSSSAAKYINGYVFPVFGVDYIVAAAVNVPQIAAGRVEFQFYGGGGTVVRANRATQTNGWEPVVGIGSIAQTSDGSGSMNFGVLKTENAINISAYIDDLVLTPCPSGMTLEQATAAMQNFMEMVARGDS